MSRKPAQVKKRQAKKGEQCIRDALTPRLLPLARAAAYLGISPWSLRERAWAGLVPIVVWPGGRKWFFDKVDLDRLIDSNKRLIN